MKRITFFSTIIVIALFLAGCVGVPSWTGNVAGWVYYEDTMDPATGVYVTIGGKTKRTDRAGYFKIQNILSGEHRLEIQGFDIVDYVISVTVP